METQKLGGLNKAIDQLEQLEKRTEVSSLQTPATTPSHLLLWYHQHRYTDLLKVHTCDEQRFSEGIAEEATHCHGVVGEIVLFQRQ